MRFFLSGEVDVLVSEDFRRISNAVEAKLNAFAADRNYGPALKEIGVIPIVLRPTWQAVQRERRLFQRKQSSADYRTWIDFKKMRDGPDSVRERLLLKNIVEAVMDLTRKAGKNFDGERLVNDILQIFGVTQSELSTI
jgi:hypothetical protein